MATDRTPPFAIDPGDTVLWVSSKGFTAGTFIRWVTKGAHRAEVTRPEDPELKGTKLIPAELLWPCNDNQHIARRGYEPYRPDTPERYTKAGIIPAQPRAPFTPPIHQQGSTS